MEIEKKYPHHIETDSTSYKMKQYFKHFLVIYLFLLLPKMVLLGPPTANRQPRGWLLLSNNGKFKKNQKNL